MTSQTIVPGARPVQPPRHALWLTWLLRLLGLRAWGRGLGMALLAMVMVLRAAQASPADGPGGPILVIGSSTVPFSTYYAEILRTEGFNAFRVADASALTPSSLAAHDIVVLPPMALTTAQRTALSDWVNAGGSLVAMAPESALAPLLGLNPLGTPLAEGWFRVEGSATPGAGITEGTLQFHGTAQRYTLAGATAWATLYSDAATATAHPALSWRTVGAGRATAFAWDVATSIALTRQGNPDWAAQERDGLAPIRSNDKFYGAASNDVKPDWVSPARLSVPQADELQRLFSYVLVQASQARRPLPRLWPFPRGLRAVVVMTGDDHGNGGTAPRFDQLRAASPAGCSVADWSCLRGTSYLYPRTPLTDAQAAAYEAEGFELSPHIDTGCADYTRSTLEGFYTTQLAQWRSRFPSLAPARTQRHHCIAWSDWVSGALVQLANGMRLDTTYYHWPGSWLGSTAPAYMTGSALPMRFAALDGTLIDVYQAATHLTDESLQAYPQAVETLLDAALGPLDYLGAFTVNAHTDTAESAVADAVVAAAKARGVPVISARQLLGWLDARNASSFGALAYANQVLSFTLEASPEARGLRATLPLRHGGRVLSALARGGVAVPWTTVNFKGSELAMFEAVGGSWSATYGGTDSGGGGGGGGGDGGTTPGCPCSAFPATAVPAVASAADTASVEVGVRFRTDVDGLVSGIRFYKGGANTGTHVGSLWSASGQLLARGTFSAETASGWQQLNFATPVAVRANTVYVASYFAPRGGYAIDAGYFSGRSVTSGSLQLLADGTAGGNGVYAYAGAPTFPSSTWRASNYWVDVVFTPAASPPPPPPPVDACATPANATVAENCLAGAPRSQWDVTGAGDTTIQGFATQMSVNRGETVAFKVKTDARAWRADIYRLGWYGGLGARQVATLQPSATLPQAQPACLSETATGLIDCGNWAVSASWAVPANAASGIYLARLVRTDTGGASHVVFVVRDDASRAEVLFQTSDTTWQAYNDYGGASLYKGGPVGRAYKVSYNRPFNTRAVANGQDWLFNAEYPMLRWLEANGYDVAYTSGADVDRDGARLRNARVFLSVGHDEYWSGAQRANVEAARDAGLHLAFFSGNELFWKTRWEPSRDASRTPYRTLVSYKETHANAKIDPDPAWTGTWRDARFSPPSDGGRPENALTGQLFLVNDGATAGITVPAAEGRLRLWRGTSLATQAVGTSTTLPVGTLGYEWDVDVDNGARPPGLMQLSRTTVANAPVLQDNGSTYASGPATHALTLYRHAGGALVFGAGTVQWAWGLDATHDRAGTPADVRMQQATVNLLADMGVQPRTLQGGLVAATASADATPPGSTITAPAAGASLAVGTAVTVSGTAADAGGGLVAGVEVSIDGGTSWRRAQGRESWSFTWTPSAAGPALLRSRAVDDSGRLETPGAGIGVTLTTPPTTCPCSLWPGPVTPTTLADADTASVTLGVRVTVLRDGVISGVRFWKGSTNTGTHVGGLWSATGQLLAQATFRNETTSGWQQVNFATPVPVKAGTTVVAGYLAPRGRYAASIDYFAATGTTTGPLSAPASTTGAANGLYRYGASLAFPNATWRATNYWVDVVFGP
ncbi:MAG: hypothetical protein RI988_3096 [Pseudomonadota bacterium]|jgi:hypothetical protein